MPVAAEEGLRVTRRRDSVLTPRSCRLCAYVVGRTDQITFTDAVLKMFVAPTVVHWPDSANDYTWFADNPSMDYPTIPWDDHFNAQRREVAKDVSSFKTSRGSKRFMRGGVISLVPTSVDDSATVDDIENDEPEAYKESTERMMTLDNMENYYALLAGSAIATELQLPQGFLYSGGSPKKVRSDFLSADVDTAEGQKFVASVTLVSLAIAIFGMKVVEAGRLRKETAFGDEAKSNESETLFPPYSSFRVLEVSHDRCHLQALPWIWEDYGEAWRAKSGELIDSSETCVSCCV
eukprot:symbB.v1.2.005113.t1/scaffold295.1/size237168/2